MRLRPWLAGFAGVQPVAPAAGMCLPEVKRRYGDRFILVGGMCNVETLATGSRRDIEREALEVAEAGGEGGVVIGSHSIDDSVPVENYEHYCRVLEELDERW